MASEDAQLVIAARIDERGRLEFGVIPPGARASEAVLPSARFLPPDRVQPVTS